MKITDGKSEIEYRGGTRVVIGKFDGIHVGHQKLIRAITDKNDELRSVVFTFTYDSKLFDGKCDRILDEDARRKKFENLGVDYLVEYELNGETSKIEPEEFLREILVKRLHAKELVCGPDLSFGYKGKGNVELIRGLSDELGISVTVMDKVQYLGEDVSSTRIHEALLNKDTKSVNAMLGDFADKQEVF